MGEFEQVHRQCIMIESRISLHFFVLFVFLASTAFAAELSSQQQIDALRAEVAASKAQIEQLNTENALLRATVQTFESRNGERNENLASSESSYNDLDLTDILQAGDTSLHSPDSDLEVKADLSAQHKAGWLLGGSFFSGRRRRTPAPTRSPTMRTCPGHCQGKCWIYKSMMDEKCVITKQYKKNLEQHVKFVGNKTWPKWQILTGTKDKKRLKAEGSKLIVRGTVSCPCHGSGGTLTEDEAVSRIIGQTTAMSIPYNIALTRAEGRVHKGPEPSPSWFQEHPYKEVGVPVSSTPCEHDALTGELKNPECIEFTGRQIGMMYGANWDARVALSVVKMINCWKHHCFKASAATNMTKAKHRQDNLLEGEELWGGGFSC